jgi:hypothetical protein
MGWSKNGFDMVSAFSYLDQTVLQTHHCLNTPIPLVSGVARGYHLSLVMYRTKRMEVAYIQRLATQSDTSKMGRYTGVNCRSSF